MDRVWKRFFFKLRMPVFFATVFFAVTGVLHFSTDQFGTSFGQVFAAVIIALVTIVGLALMFFLVLVPFLEVYQKAKEEIEEENNAVIEVLKDEAASNERFVIRR